MNLEMSDCLEVIVTYAETFFNAFQGFVVSFTCCFMHRDAQIELIYLILHVLKKLRFINETTYMKCVESELIRKLRIASNNHNTNYDRAQSIGILNTETQINPLLIDKTIDKRASLPKTTSLENATIAGSFASSKTKRSSSLIGKDLNNNNVKIKASKKDEDKTSCCLCLFGNQKNDFYQSNRHHSRIFHRRHSAQHQQMNSNNASPRLGGDRLQLTHKKEKKSLLDKHSDSSGSNITDQAYQSTVKSKAELSEIRELNEAKK
jgi:hypothetical protein